MSKKPDTRADGHVAYKCWSCGRDNAIPVKYDEKLGRKFPYWCDRCSKKVTVEITEIVRFSPKVRIIIETRAWFQHFERTTP
jgi:DNA-directed RNA polymerase subunit RPC12/RpoP